MESQLLDNMDLERERGITIKARAVKLSYKAQDGDVYETEPDRHPGPCGLQLRGVLLPWPPARELFWWWTPPRAWRPRPWPTPIWHWKPIWKSCPYSTKSTCPPPTPSGAKQEVEDIIGLVAEDAPEISAKQGVNIESVLEDIVANVPAPKGDPAAPLRALIFDSQYDPYGRHRLFPRDGGHPPHRPNAPDGLRREYEVLECGYLKPWAWKDRRPDGRRGGVFHRQHQKTWPTPGWATPLPEAERPAAEPLPGYKGRPAYGVLRHLHRGRQQIPNLRDALEKLQLNDASLSFEPESSAALGFGFRCGFLGMLHMEIIQERLEREFDLDLVTTLPSVIYEVVKTDGTTVSVDNPTTIPTRRRLRKPTNPMPKCPSVAAGIHRQHYAHVPGAPGRLQRHPVSGHQSGGTAL